jgi:membrane protease YdiL (CAAX protease family)
MFSRVLSILFVLFLVAGLPILSSSTTRESQIRQMPRLALYMSAAISEWVVAGLGLLIFFFSSLSAFSIGFRTLAPAHALASAGALVVLAVAGVRLGLFLETRGWWPPEAELVYLLIPQTRHEKFWSLLLLAPTAALCEEFLYRGFLLAQLAQWMSSSVWAWAGSSLAFGLAHVYQGWHGMVRASLLGALLAYPVIHFGSLYPSMLAHALIDALALVWLGPKFLPPRREEGTGNRD